MKTQAGRRTKHKVCVKIDVCVRVCVCERVRTTSAKSNDDLYTSHNWTSRVKERERGCGGKGGGRGNEEVLEYSCNFWVIASTLNLPPKV